MSDPLAPLLADGVIDEICARLKSGKEADLWLVRHGAEIVAAKVYKARESRSFRNDAVYREGRRVRDTRTQRAMDRGSRFGQAAAEDAWKAKEADALHALHAAGVRVPRPVMFYEGVLLMELVVDADGHPAPRLVDATVPREAAAALYADLRAQAVRMLSCDLVHGDLSPYNVLLGREGPVVIDFPQVVGAAHNTQAEAFFLRDLENLRRHLAGIDPALRASSGDGREIWRAYVRRELTPDFVPTGRAPEPEARRPDRHERHSHPGGQGREPRRPGGDGRQGGRDAGRQGGDAARSGSEAGGRGSEGRQGSDAGRQARDAGRQAGDAGRQARDAGRQAGGAGPRARDAGHQSGGAGGRARDAGRRDRPERAGAAPARPAPVPPGRPEPRGPHTGTSPGRAEPRASSGAGMRGPRTPRRGPERGRGGPGPEVIRVVRPPLAKPGSAGPRAPAAHPGSPPAHGGHRPQEPRHDRSRRRG
jgi:RIO kinase 1